MNGGTLLLLLHASFSCTKKNMHQMFQNFMYCNDTPARGEIICMKNVSPGYLLKFFLLYLKNMTKTWWISIMKKYMHIFSNFIKTGLSQRDFADQMHFLSLNELSFRSFGPLISAFFWFKELWIMIQE